MLELQLLEERERIIFLFTLNKPIPSLSSAAGSKEAIPAFNGALCCEESPSTSQLLTLQASDRELGSTLGLIPGCGWPHPHVFLEHLQGQ